MIKTTKGALFCTHFRNNTEKFKRRSCNISIHIDCGDTLLEDTNRIKSLDGKHPKVCIKTMHVGRVRSRKRTK